MQYNKHQETLLERRNKAYEDRCTDIKFLMINGSIIENSKRERLEQHEYDTTTTLTAFKQHENEVRLLEYKLQEEKRLMTKATNALERLEHDRVMINTEFNSIVEKNIGHNELLGKTRQKIIDNTNEINVRVRHNVELKRKREEVASLLRDNTYIQSELNRMS